MERQGPPRRRAPAWMGGWMAVGLGLLAGGPALAQATATPGPVPGAEAAYPDRPIRLIVATAAGGASDIVARLVGQKLSEAWGQPVVVDPRPGANGNVAAQLAAHSPPDGYTLMMGTIGVMAVNRAIYRDIGYDPAVDFDPVARLVSFSNILVVHPSVPVHSLAEFVNYARARPGRVTYGTPGNGGSLHLAMVVLSRMADIQVVHVPYRGAAASLNDLIAGNLVAAFSDPLVTLPQVEAGRVRALAVSGAHRLAVAPQIPTVAEAGFPGYDVSGWLGIVAPRGTPPAVVSRLNQAFNEIVRQPDTAARLTAQGAEVVTGTPAEFGAFIRAEIARWAEVTAAAGIRAE
ncbi:tripartite tricarboxylate transporter substrate binding protein [Roseomonas sp. NAR14]|uniref:Tripartite tricarboxylate transporter substrate binding protein n=1 Tax=Roseomonas acroporae TaxID=2937791 RepID=A0A9X1YDA0_9PROT|nr:tripartite tricarboxylate transporter substrate binding protein [Roseomonas acroporae]MCK8787660.1 tripartite tricarboxylate transporter substrate binding protein [Roseomonas acroporae]